MPVGSHKHTLMQLIMIIPIISSQVLMILSVGRVGRTRTDILLSFTKEDIFNKTNKHIFRKHVYSSIANYLYFRCVVVEKLEADDRFFSNLTRNVCQQTCRLRVSQDLCSLCRAWKDIYIYIGHSTAHMNTVDLRLYYEPETGTFFSFNSLTKAAKMLPVETWALGRSWYFTHHIFVISH